MAYPVFFAVGWVIGRVLTRKAWFMAALMVLAVMALAGCDDHQRATERHFAVPERPEEMKGKDPRIDKFRPVW